MRNSVFAALAATALFGAGCSAGMNPSPPSLAGAASNAPSGWLALSAKSGKGLLYVSVDTASGDEVAIFKQRGADQQPIGAITAGVDKPFGLLVDSRRNLYVANWSNGTVTVYPPGQTSPSETLTGAGAPLAVVVARDGTVYVASNKNGSNGKVLRYKKGHTKPSSTVVTFGKDRFPIGLALDSAGNLFVAHDRNNSAPVGRVLEVPAGSSTGKDLGIRVGYAGALTTDKHNDLLLVDQNGNCVDVFPPGSKSPSREICGFYQGLFSIFGVAINRANDEIWVTNAAGYVYGVTYPAGQIVDTITVTLGSSRLTLGVATSPAGTE